MNFEEYDKIIKKHKYDMLELIIYYNLKCNENLQLDYVNLKSKNIQKQLETLIYFIYKAYLKDENHIDLGYMCDKAVEFKNEILKEDLNNFNTWDFLGQCYIEKEEI